MESSSSSSNSGGDHVSSNPNPLPNSPPRPPLPASPLRQVGPPSPRLVRPVAAVPPVMGVAGVSAFSPYSRPNPRPTLPPGRGCGSALSAFSAYRHNDNRPPPTRHDWIPRASGIGPFFGAAVVPVGGSGGVAVEGGGGLRLGGSPAARKRSAAGGSQREGSPIICSICGRQFSSAKALFGHMRSHPNRGWRGAHPPPAFRAEEEFADVPGLINRPAAAPAEGGGGGTQGAAVEENYSVPDLNKPPPSSPAE